MWNVEKRKNDETPEVHLKVFKKLQKLFGESENVEFCLMIEIKCTTDIGLWLYKIFKSALSKDAFKPLFQFQQWCGILFFSYKAWKPRPS